ncbi:hypothetical protein ACE4Z7_24355, partial [Salmonella enterica]|uniref:hypothetical protein n=1 Tax=Salmonella enterica TaxID=28901 RepID=UPI003D28CCCF
AAILGLTLILLALPAWGLLEIGGGWGWILGLLLLGIFPAMDAAIMLVNRSVSAGLQATLLPALAFKDGIPSAHRTIIVVPTMLTTIDAIAEQVK